MTEKEFMKKEKVKIAIEAYKELDKAFRKVMQDFWKKHKDVDAYSTGSELYGQFSVMRSLDFDGLTFKVTDRQMTDLVSNALCIVYEKDLINQKQLKVPKNVS